MVVPNIAERRRHFFTLNQEDMGPDRESARKQLAHYILSGLQHAVYVMQGPQTKIPPLEEDFNPIVVHLFEEGSTRTDVSNRVAEIRKGCHVMPLVVNMSSLIKGEVLEDTADTLAGYQISSLVLRTSTLGAARHIAHTTEELEGPENWIYPGFSVISGGEGPLTHAQQVVLDLTTMFTEDGFADKGIHILNMDQWQELDKALKSESTEALLERICQFIDELRICYVGDSKNSRIVSSAIHLAEYFDIHYLFVGPKQLRIDEGSISHINAEPSDRLTDAMSWPRIYALRTQLERLTGTPDAPGQMTERDAIALIKEFLLGHDFLSAYDGKVYHARPRDGKHPMIPLEIKDQRLYPGIRYMTQSFMGPPTRMGIFQTCHDSRHLKTTLIPAPSMDESNIIIHSDPSDTWNAHQTVLNGKYRDRPMTFMSIEDGEAQDRLEDDRVGIHHQLNYELGVYAGRKGPVSVHSGLWSVDREVYKGTIAIFGAYAPPLAAAIHGLVSPGVRFSIMKKTELGPNGEGSYQRVEYPLPEFVEVFDCLEPRCITNRTGTAKCIHRVTGKKGEVDGDNWPKVGMECVSCETRNTAREVVMHKYGSLVRKIS